MGLRREDGQSRGPFTKPDLLRYATNSFFFFFSVHDDFSPSSSQPPLSPFFDALRSLELLYILKKRIGCRKRNSKPSQNPSTFPLRVQLHHPMSQRIVVIPRGTCISPTKPSQQCKHSMALLLLFFFFFFFFFFSFFFFSFFFFCYCHCYFSSRTNNNRIRPREHMVQSRA